MIVLVGFMGAGKTTIGKLLAERLGLPFLDIDALIEERGHRSIGQIFMESGEDTFRRIEHETIVEALAGPEAVLSLGGGSVEDPGTRVSLRSAFVVYLEVGYDEALQRTGNDVERPMLANPNIKNIYMRRLPLYAEVSRLTVNTTGKLPEQVVAAIKSVVESSE